MSTAPSSPHRKLWEEKNVVVALILAVLVPGLGHLYQGRTVKGLIYLFGILGLFLWGVKLGQGVVVYNLPEQGVSRRVTLHYAAQFCAGAVAWPALFQKQRASSPKNLPVKQLEKPLTAKFSGVLRSAIDEPGGKLEGVVNFTPEIGGMGTETKGSFTGTLDGQPIQLQLAGSFFLDRPISAGFRRYLSCGVVGANDPVIGAGREIVGTIPRSFIDGYGVPPDPEQIQEVTGRLGKVHELALVFTWIAGLLNVLAIWDCVQGPAYGFGDETWPTPATENAESPKPAEPPPAPKTTATA
jgi:hypothetical protein